MMLKPAMTEDNVLFSKASDSKQHTFRVTLITENDINHLADRSCFVGSTINIEDRNCSLESSGREARPSHEGFIHKAKTSGTRINEGVSGNDTLIDRGLELDAYAE